MQRWRLGHGDADCSSLARVQWNGAGAHAHSSSLASAGVYVVPVPDSATVWVCALAPVPVVVTLSIADRAPWALGVKITSIVQLDLGSNVMAQLDSNEKSPALVPRMEI